MPSLWPRGPSRSQHWPGLAVVAAGSLLRVVLCPSLQLQAALTLLSFLGRAALCAAPVSPCSPLTACVGGSPGRRGCGDSRGLSPCVAVCLSPGDFSSLALQVPPLPLLPVGTLGAVPGGSPSPVKGPGAALLLLTGAGQPGLAPGRALPRQGGVRQVCFVCQEEEEEEEDNISETLSG